MPTATLTLCVGCKTPVRPDKIRCDKCRSVRLDKLLDHRLLTTGGHAMDSALALTSQNARDHQP
jgi:hypothetical protein